MKNGSCCPAKCVFARKSGLEARTCGWGFRYDGTFRPFMIPEVHQRTHPAKPVFHQRRKRRPIKPPGESGSANDEFGRSSGDSDDTDRSVETLLDANANGEDERAGDLIFWFSDGALGHAKKNAPYRGTKQRYILRAGSGCWGTNATSSLTNCPTS